MVAAFTLSSSSIFGILAIKSRKLHFGQCVVGQGVSMLMLVWLSRWFWFDLKLFFSENVVKLGFLS
jgi:hypothetical protein